MCLIWTETPLPGVTCWSTGDSGLHPWRLCLLLHVPLSPPVDAHLLGHADLCTREAFPALLLYCRAAWKNKYTVWPTKTKRAMLSAPANTHLTTFITTPGTHAFTGAHGGVAHGTCSVSALATRRASVFTRSAWDVTASRASTMHADWVAQSNVEPVRIAYSSSQASRIQSAWVAFVDGSSDTGKWTGVSWSSVQVDPAQAEALS